jgi:hypothetical protein
MNPGLIWLSADAELPVRVKKTTASEKCMLIVCWGIHGITHYCWLPKDSTLNSPFFCEELLSPVAQKMQPNSKKTRKSLTLIQMDNARVRKARAIQEKLDVSRFKRTPHPLYRSDIAPSDFSFRLTENLA